MITGTGREGIGLVRHVQASAAAALTPRTSAGEPAGNLDPSITDAAAVALSFIRANGDWISRRFGFKIDPRRYRRLHRMPLGDRRRGQPLTSNVGIAGRHLRHDLLFGTSELSTRMHGHSVGAAFTGKETSKRVSSSYVVDL